MIQMVLNYADKNMQVGWHHWRNKNLLWRLQSNESLLERLQSNESSFSASRKETKKLIIVFTFKINEVSALSVDEVCEIGSLDTTK